MISGDALLLITGLLWLGSFLWLLGTTVLARLQPLKRRAAAPPHELPPVSIIVPTSAAQDERGVAEREAAVASLLSLEYPHYEIIVCLDRGTADGALARRLRETFRDDRVSVIVAATQSSANAKVDAMASGADQARYDTLVYSDDDVLLDPQHVVRLLAQRQAGVGLVSAPAVGVQPANLWGDLELSFMNGQFGRLHLAGDFLGLGGVLGKSILLHRSAIPAAGGLYRTGLDCCEDAALTQNFAASGMRTVLSEQPVFQPVGRQRFTDVWRRHQRWLSCRRKYIPGTFVCEALFSTPAACLSAATMFSLLGLDPAVGASITAVVWGVMDSVFVLTGRCGYSVRTPLAWLLRESIFLPMWVSALFARTVRWHGRRVPVVSSQKA